MSEYLLTKEQKYLLLRGYDTILGISIFRYGEMIDNVKFVYKVDADTSDVYISAVNR